MILLSSLYLLLLVVSIVVEALPVAVIAVVIVFVGVIVISIGRRGARVIKTEGGGSGSSASRTHA